MGQLTKATTGTAKRASAGELIINPYTEQISVALPKSYTPERFIRILQTVLNSNAQLQKCDKASLLGAIFTCAQLGLEPNTFGQCYIIPYGTKAEFQLGYRGIIELVRRSDLIADIYAEVVHEKDVFEVKAGLDRDIKHIIDYTSDRGNITAVYSVAVFKDGTKHFQVMSKSEVDAIRNGAPSKNSPAWKNYFGEMAKKTCIKRMSKLLPISPDDQRRIDSDEKFRNVNLEELDAGSQPEEMSLLPADEVKTIDVDQPFDKETGEVLEKSTDEKAKHES